MTTSLLLDPAMRGDVAIPGEVMTSESSAWPRMIRLDEETETRLVSFLEHEITLAYQERQQVVDDWIQWQKDYWAKPETPEKNFPFRRAANIVIPLNAIAVEAVYARAINTLFSVEPFFTIRPKAKEWIEAAPHVEEWLQTEVENPQALNMFKFCRDSILECIKLGTCVGKSGYYKDIRKSLTVGGPAELERWVTVRDGATLDHVPLANFLIRFFERDPQQAVWVGEEHTFNWAQLKRMCVSGQYDNKKLELVKTYWVNRNAAPSASGEYEEAIDLAAKTEPVWNEVFRVQEIWMSFDVDGDGYDEEIVVDFHRDSRSILAIRYNWYDDLHRPYRVGVYLPVEGRIFGIGIGKQTEQFQKLITTIHRQRLDNATLANMAQLALKKNSGYGPGEPIFPGKMWFLEDPQNDIKEFKLSDVYSPQIDHEEYARAYLEKRTGVNEVVLGMPQQGTGGTATGDLARLAEGKQKFDLFLKNVRIWLGELGTDVLANYQQFGDNQRHWLVQESGQWVEQILTLPTFMVRGGAIVELNVTDSVNNAEVKQQQWMGAFSILNQHYMQMTSMAASIDPLLGFAVGQASLIASDIAVRRMLETFREARLQIDDMLLYPRLKEYFDAKFGGIDPATGGIIPATQQLSGVEGLLALTRGGSEGTDEGGSGSNGRPNNQRSQESA